MLRGKDAGATLAVSDLQRARDFYENTLGLAPVQGNRGASCTRVGTQSCWSTRPSTPGQTRQRLQRGRSAMTSTRSSRNSDPRCLVRALRPAGHDA